MAAPTLKQLWKRAPTAPSAEGGTAEGGGDAPVVVDDADAMAKEPSQKQQQLDDSGSLQKKPPAAADASITVVTVDEKVRESVNARVERRRREESSKRRRIWCDRFSKSIPQIFPSKATHLLSLYLSLSFSSHTTLSLPFSRPSRKMYLLLAACEAAEEARRRALPSKTR